MKNTKVDRKRVVVVSDNLAPWSVGGLEDRYKTLRDTFQSETHDLYFASMRLWEAGENPTHHFAISKKRELYKGSKRRKLPALLFALSCFKVVFLKPDVIEADQIPSLNIFPLWVVSKICRAKFTVTWHEVWDRASWIEYLGFFGNIGFMVDKISLNFPDRIFAASDFTRTRLLDLGIDPEKIINLHEDLDVKRIREARTELAGADVLYAGRLLKHKRLDALVRSIATLKGWGKDCKLIIVGEGPELDFLQQLTKDLLIQSQVTFYPFFSNKETMWALMNKSKIFDSPSEREGYGIAVSEALAAGMQVIVVDAPDNAAKKQVKGNSNGTLLANNDPVNHASAILDILRKMQISDTALKRAGEKSEIEGLKNGQTMLAEIYESTWQQTCK
jgi:glycosyltransferase involved in cell wall biosynthesis